MSDIFPPQQAVREEIVKDKTTEDNISFTRDMLQSIVFNAFEEQKRMVDATPAEAIKVDFSDGIKRGYEFLVNPLYSSTTGQEMEHHYVQSPKGLHHPTKLQASHLLNPSQIGNTGRPSSVINVPAQSVSKLLSMTSTVA